MTITTTTTTNTQLERGAAWNLRGGRNRMADGRILGGTYWAQGDAPVHVRHRINEDGKHEKSLDVVNCGGGRQSSAWVLMACAGEVPAPSVVIMADTGDERPQTLEYWWSTLVPAMEQAGIPWRLVARMHTHETQSEARGNIRADMIASVRDGKRIAQSPLFLLHPEGRKRGMAKRACTVEYKIDPITKCIRDLLGLEPGQRWEKKNLSHRAVQTIGIATEESERATGLGNGQGTEMVYPLLELDMSTDDCIEKIEELTNAPAPCKSACRACPFRDDVSWALMRRDDPESFASAVELDEKLRHPFGLGRLNDGLSVADYLSADRDADGRIKGLDRAAYLHGSCTPLSQVELPELAADATESFVGGEC